MNYLKEDIQKIVDDGDLKEMRELSDILIKVANMVYDYDEKEGKKIEMQIYEMAHGKKLTDNMKRQWVEQMRPSAKWSEQEIKDVVDNYGIDIPYLSVYVIMNKFYSDTRKAFEESDGDEEKSLRRYIEATKGWYYDSDATNTEEAKLYCYWKYIVN